MPKVRRGKHGGARPGAGRPYADPTVIRDISCSFYLPSDLYSRLREAQSKPPLSNADLSIVVRAVALRGIETIERSNPKFPSGRAGSIRLNVRFPLPIMNRMEKLRQIDESRSHLIRRCIWAGLLP